MHVLVLGSGQLARMMSLAGAPLNIQISAYDVGSGNVVHPLTQQVLGHGLENAIEQVDAITAEFEHIPHDVLDICELSGKFLPSTAAIKAGGDRRVEKALLDNAGVRNAKHYVIETREDFERAIEHVGIPMVLKSALGGYDGKGQWRLKEAAQIETIWAEMAECIAATPTQAIVAEEFVPFNREVSLVGARGKDGSVEVYPLAENVHTNGVLSLSTAIDAPELQAQAKQMFTAVADSLDSVGVLALEFFDVEGTLLVNEIAPRVHNSGHWTQQGAETCQFENHLRAVCGLPLGSTKLIRETSMVNILGEDTLPEALLAMDGCHIHWYGKEKREGRKMGHINVCGDYPGELHRRLCALAEVLDPMTFPAVHEFAKQAQR
ncbi:TPA: 5-(carboxyamino)imidazole ribonucleotide synthase [Vibrio parahaemolyticus]|uniref:5-(carboxyamino)imidazole ribonucleotide synthase n=1 Tax=Vibrio parahaemolyticus TaxID=670 RepID=UPI0010F3D36A|nr:5-(carboxyamino)imidazole ribonucleotide synthase [Vibrio parahaemolyticus]EHK7406458.1 5-(carboxyamino)imidazole ribonucleotide synthase [Vibrio parahaemolyticus]MBE4394415.1 5-(carboxyamino)imidazole ribonucleotide synthase [Vibrio parahaemolyticus]TBT16481.1 5-(carboxyamino)imidazole ribonucleotide synthase [Vibrio parahaemolyticus]TNX92665.1 5-(carboxyamino)imidazole ribonucleotide synthase [Vibrio parahaemolyticus]TOH01209.1 5-(carboxyamino)imidazole ribonucleotide synthase [Vibrio par